MSSTSPLEVTSKTDMVPPPAYTADSSQEVTSSPASPTSRPLSRTSSQTSSLPGYDDSTAIAAPGLPPSEVSFSATAAFQIQTPGKRWFSLPAAPIPPDPIPIYSVPVSGPASSVLDSAAIVVPTYVSLRHTRGSGNCVLIHGSSFPELSSSSTLADDIPVLATTQYRFGAGKAPSMRIYADGSGPSPSDAFDTMHASRRGGCRGKPSDEARALDGAGAGDAPAYELQPTADHKMSFTTDICPVSIRSRAVRFSTPLGAFQWRYSTRAERKAMGAHSLLVLERLVTIAEAYPSSSSDVSSTLRVPIGFFIRSDDTRSPGTSRSTAGNGGRLLLDLRAWDPKGYAVPVFGDADSTNSVVDEKRRLMAADEASAEAMDTVERIAITTCLCMLKKEVDRRRLYQALILSGAAGGV
ncbi:hypothetical protein F5X68DRAFT_260853 [Plectosphaerella plurivora]|uniref:Uncharacterized protein n=1 Tax=Plectosphaerella plurivora TaxID=936078 RepID=A0A9P9ADE7_9PEZI|nr:hypothetical protein F5X68DRAFT_260853 [Plectosphaerella plurivora]